MKVAEDEEGERRTIYVMESERKRVIDFLDKS